jgi:hypothetical protein
MDSTISPQGTPSTRAQVGAQATRPGYLSEIPGARQWPKAASGTAAEAPRGTSSASPEGPCGSAGGSRGVHADLRRYPLRARPCAAVAAVHATASANALRRR